MMMPAWAKLSYQPKLQQSPEWLWEPCITCRPNRREVKKSTFGPISFHLAPSFTKWSRENWHFSAVLLSRLWPRSFMRNPSRSVRWFLMRPTPFVEQLIVASRRILTTDMPQPRTLHGTCLLCSPIPLRLPLPGKQHSSLLKSPEGMRLWPGRSLLSPFLQQRFLQRTILNAVQSLNRSCGLTFCRRKKRGLISPGVTRDRSSSLQMVLVSPLLQQLRKEVDDCLSAHWIRSTRDLWKEPTARPILFGPPIADLLAFLRTV